MVIVFFPFLFLVVCVPCVTAFLMKEQFLALEALYNETSGDSWDFGTHNATPGKVWDFTKEDADPCVDNWKGVICNLTHVECINTTCGIRSLILNSINMAGELPNDMTQLTNLLTLSLEGNTLSSSLPSFLGTLTALEILSLGDNFFSA
jgi:hypothetical protein